MEFFRNHPAQVLILLFFIVTFGISLIEKLIDWKGTVTYMKAIFEKTIVTRFVKPLLAILMLLEFLTMYFLLVGVYHLYYMNESEAALLGCYFAGVSFIYMLIGQRVVKDYPGSTSLTVYFILSVFGVFLLS